MIEIEAGCDLAHSLFSCLIHRGGGAPHNLLKIQSTSRILCFQSMAVALIGLLPTDDWLRLTLDGWGFF